MNYAILESPLGGVMVAGDAGGYRRLGFLESGERPEPGWTHREEPLRGALEQLEAYFRGELESFDLPLAPEGTPFQRQVWAMVRAIPYGTTETYGRLARRLGRPGAARAVGAANGRNPIAIVIPCHRVVGSDGQLTGYRGGLCLKAALLGLERATGPAGRAASPSPLPTRPGGPGPRE